MDTNNSVFYESLASAEFSAQPIANWLASMCYVTAKETFIKQGVQFFQQVDFLWKKNPSPAHCVIGPSIKRTVLKSSEMVFCFAAVKQDWAE